MGLEIKRVAAGFDWPLGEIWKGFINPYFRECPEHNKTCWSGQTAAGEYLDRLCQFIQTLGADAAMQPRQAELVARGLNHPHPYIAEWPCCPMMDLPSDIKAELAAIKDRRQWGARLGSYLREHPSRPIPYDAELAKFISELAGRDLSLGSRGAYVLREKLLTLAGMDAEAFGECPVCKGDDLDPAVREQYDSWQESEPPAGDWWQLWETVSEGSPVTPAFATKEQLVEYLVRVGHGSTPEYREPWKRESAEAFVEAGWAPSGIIESGKYIEAKDIPAAMRKVKS